MHTCLLLAFFAVVSQLAAQQHAGSETPADVETGSRIYGLHCSPCHGANGNLIAAADLLRGQFRHGSSDEDLKRIITQGIPGTAMPSNQFNSSELTAVVAYLRSMRDYESRAVQMGDAHRGRQLFEASSGCLTCHRVNGNGSRLAPDLRSAPYVPPPRFNGPFSIPADRVFRSIGSCAWSRGTVRRSAGAA